MIKDVRYSGYTAIPSDYECQDGELAASLNIISEDSQLKPIFKPDEQLRLPDSFNPVYLHKTSIFTHYIISKGQSFYWIDKPDKGAILDDSSFTSSNLLKTYANNITVYEVKSIGNSLVILASDSLHYFMWKDNDYKYLGTHIPELPLSFGLQGTREESSEEFEVTFEESVTWSSSILSNEFSDSMKKSVTSQVLAKVNKFIADKYTNGNQFMYPFFVRYAYRLYDGSLTMHSAPILMVCSNLQNPLVLGRHSHQHDDGYDGTWDTQNISNCKVYAALFKLDFAVVAQKYINALQEWSDIVSSVDIFVSAPLYSFDQSGQVEGVDAYKAEEIGGKNAYCVCKATHGGDYSTYYQYHSMVRFMFYGKSELPGYSFRLPLKGTQTQKENIISASQFYLLKSYKISNLSTERTLVDVEKGYFRAILNREVMTDDYDSHSGLSAKYGFEYNSRLNIAGIKRVLARAFHMSSMLPYTNGFLQKKSDGTVDKTYENVIQTISMFVYIKENGKEIVSRSLDLHESVIAGGLVSEAEFGKFTPQAFIYYPNANAYKAVFYFHEWVDDGSLFGGTGERITCREIALEPHSMLNGAFYFGDWAENAGTEVALSGVNKGSSNDADRAVDVPNKIYTSEVNDPFNFPALGINTVGTGTILGICSAVKALSQGQFGQFPLYAFATDGVWALEVSSTGSYSAKQPVTRDVCINNKSITQIDTAVLFATNRGIMIIEGSVSQCISDILLSNQTFNVDSLPKLTDVIGNEVAGLLNLVPFSEFLKNCRMLYDYIHQRILVYNNTLSYSYVYSLKSKQWGIVSSSIKDTLNSYPDALALCSVNDGEDGCVNTVVDYSSENASGNSMKAVLISRPLKLDMPDILKTIDTIIQRGVFRTGSVKTILYGSRDLFNWHYIYSSNDHYLRGFRGTPFKYFRIVLICDLQQDESIFGCTVQYTPRFINQPR